MIARIDHNGTIEGFYLRGDGGMPQQQIVRQGVVARLVRDKGFGFIKTDGSRECFFHRSAAPEWDDISEGSEVEFVETETPKGLRAENVRLA